MSSLSLMAPGSGTGHLGLGATNPCYQPVLPHPVPGAELNLGRDIFHERAFGVGPCKPWSIQLCLHMETASSLAQGRASDSGGGKAWLSPSADANSPCVPSHVTGPPGLRFLIHIVEGSTVKAQGPVQLFPCGGMGLGVG